jgi:hypothetical protein
LEGEHTVLIEELKAAKVERNAVEGHSNVLQTQNDELTAELAEFVKTDENVRR